MDWDNSRRLPRRMRGDDAMAACVGDLVQASHVLVVPTRGKGFVELTRAVAGWLKSFGAGGGLLTVFVSHTSASLTIQENADPNVRRDLLDALEILAPEDRAYAHDEEGPDDMPCRATSRPCSPR